MTTAGSDARAARAGDAGFSLTELLIVVAILAFSLAAVFGVYQVTQRSTQSSIAGEEAQVQLRAVLDRIAADLRMLGAGRATSSGALASADSTSIEFDGDVDSTLSASGSPVTVSDDPQVNSGSTTITVTDAINIECGRTITFTDGPIKESLTLAASCKSGNTLTVTSGLQSYYPKGSYVNTPETISYRWYGSSSGLLCRKTGGSCPAAAPAADSEDVVATGVTNFALTYYANQSTTPMSSPIDRDDVRAIKVAISLRGASGDQAVTRKMDISVRPRNFF